MTTASQQRLKFRRLVETYAIVKLASDALIPAWATKGEFTSISRTADELSIVCPIEHIPADVHSPHRWTCLKLEGPFPFELTGVLLSFIKPLSSGGVSIFAISTFDTDYVLVQEQTSAQATTILIGAGHQQVS